MKAFNDYIKSLEERIEVLEALHRTLPPITPPPSPIEVISESESEDVELGERIINRARTPINDELVFRGRGQARVTNEYIALSGNQPRIYGTEEILNVEAEVDFYTIDYGDKNWSGLSIGVRSHPEGHSTRPELAHTYYFRMRKDMRVDFNREVRHANPRIADTLIRKDFKWAVKTWYNIKFRCYTLGKRTYLEGYVNNELVLEYVDDDERMIYKGVCFIRNTDIGEARYKNFKYREIEIEEEEKKKEQVVGGYYCEWSIYQHKYFLRDVPMKKLDILIYSFMFFNPTRKDLTDASLKFPPVPYAEDLPEGFLVPHDEFAFNRNMKDLRDIKRKYPNKKILVSIGGWTLSFNISKILRDDNLRKVAVDSIVDFLNKNNFDGVEFDFEYPNRVGRKENKNLDNQRDPDMNDGFYMKKFYTELRELKPDIFIGTAIGCNREVFKAYKGCETLIDKVFMMNYDYSGKTWGIGEPQSSIKQDEFYLNMLKEETNFTDRQILIGIPLYMRGQFKDPKNNNKVLNFGKDYNEDGLISLKDIEESEYIIKYNQIEGYSFIEDEEFIYTGADIPKKVKLSNKYGGVFFFHLGDYDINELF